KGIGVETLLDALANALVSAYKRMPGAAEEAVVTVDPQSGEIRVYGQELDEDGNVVREWDDTPDDFGRIAAQTAKQVILQRIREAERDLKYEEYAGREGDIVTGMIQQSDNRYTLLSLGNVEALLPQAEQVPYERYNHNERLKAYIVEVRKTSKGPQIVVSRALQPAKVKEVRLDEEIGTATVIVHDYQLSLAIGKEGQNARLAARLTGWRIDIKSETQLAEEEEYANQDWAEGEWVEDESGEMVWQPAEGGEAISAEAWASGSPAEAGEPNDTGAKETATPAEQTLSEA